MRNTTGTCIPLRVGNIFCSVCMAPVTVRLKSYDPGVKHDKINLVISPILTQTHMVNMLTLYPQTITSPLLKVQRPSVPADVYNDLIRCG